MMQRSTLTNSRLTTWTRLFDWVLLVLVGCIGAIGFLNLNAASSILAQPLHIMQLLWFGVGIVLFAIPCAVVDYRFFERWSYLIFGVVGFMLFLVLLVGTELNGSRRWLDIGLFNAQPSELMKVAVIMMIAKYFSSREKRGGYSLTDLAAPFGLIAVPMLLILRQPDLGTAVLLLLLGLSIAFFEGVKASSVLVLFLSAVAMAPVAWLGMQDYQRDRIKTFLQIEEDPYGRDWQVKNSVIAVGAGGTWGRGFGKGTQIQKGFVPEPENDFALANWAEERGFVGSTALLLLYLALVAWALRIARGARDRFGMLMSVGVAALIFWQVIINVGMVLRWMPVVGITLPLVSYGGSSVVTVLVCMGLLMNVSVRRHVYKS